MDRSLWVDSGLSRLTAINPMVSDQDRAMRLEQQIGSLKVGKQADMIVLDRDVLTVDPEALRDTQVLQTWFAGKQIYQR